MNKKLASLVLVLSAFSLGLLAKNAAPANSFFGKAEFIVNNGEEPSTLDPSKASSATENRIIKALFEGLVEYDPKTNLALPGVAESWTTSADGMTITFQLRK